MTASPNALSAWQTFYVIVGASGGALIGLHCVVIGIHNAWDTVTYLATPQEAA